MKKISFFSILLLALTLVSGCALTNSNNQGGIQKSTVAETPETLITIIEEEAVEGNVKPYLEKTYFSDSFENKLQNQLGISLDDFRYQFKRNILFAIPKNEIDRIEFDGKTSDHNARQTLSYIVYYKLDSQGNTPPPRKDMSHLVKVNNQWMIDIETEFTQLGILK